MRIFVDDELKSLNYFFLLEKNKWIFTSSIEDSTLVVLHPNQFFNQSDIAVKINTSQVILVWPLESMPQKDCKRLSTTSLFYEKHKKILFGHCDTSDSAINDLTMIPYALMFNRQKLYFTEYNNEMCDGKFWTWNIPKEAYTLSNIDKKNSHKNKTFLVPNRIRNPEQILSSGYFRLKLKNILEDANCSMYISDFSKGTFLETNVPTDHEMYTVLDLKKGGLFSPASDYYYNTSYISLGIESTPHYSDLFYPSEKYFDPLIKGNFPLIFSNYKTIFNLKKIYDFKFPNWIDYSYDDIEDPEKRFESYTKSVLEVSKLSLEKIHELYVRDKPILEHNRQIFFTHPYDSLYDKVRNSIEKLGW